MQPGFERNLLIPAGVVNPLAEEKIWLQGSRDVKEFLMMEELEQSWLDLAVWLVCHIFINIVEYCNESLSSNPLRHV